MDRPSGRPTGRAALFRRTARGSGGPTRGDANTPNRPPPQDSEPGGNETLPYPFAATPTLWPCASANTPKVVPGTFWTG